MKRVVVTGLGAITPLGNNVSEFWDNLIKGTCGIKEITKFDTTNYKVKLAAEVHQFDPLQYMDKMELRHTDLYAQYALAAAVSYTHLDVYKRQKQYYSRACLLECSRNSFACFCHRNCKTH